MYDIRDNKWENSILFDNNYTNFDNLFGITINRNNMDS